MATPRSTVKKSMGKRDALTALTAEKTPVEAPSGGSKKKAKKEDKELTPEEVERRQKQRDARIEALALQAKGEGVAEGRKHPLNSERRRANRRKRKVKEQAKKSAKAKPSGFIKRLADK